LDGVRHEEFLEGDLGLYCRVFGPWVGGNLSFGMAVKPFEFEVLVGFYSLPTLQLLGKLILVGVPGLFVSFGWDFSLIFL